MEQCPNRVGKSAREMMLEKESHGGLTYFQRYINAFMNTNGGVLMFGIDDDGRVEGCTLSEKDLEQVKKRLDQTWQQLDPQVDDGWVHPHFSPVIDEETRKQVVRVEETQKGKKSKPLWVVSVLVDPDKAKHRYHPVYYLCKEGKYARRALIRQEEQIQQITNDLVKERESQFISREGKKPGRLVDIQSLKMKEKFDAEITNLTKLLSKASEAAQKKRLCVLLKQLNVPEPSADTDGSSMPIVCVVGQSGCGKSSMMAALAQEGKHIAKVMKQNCIVTGHFFCNRMDPDTLDPGKFMGHFVASLCDKMPTFKEWVGEHTDAMQSMIRQRDTNRDWEDLMYLDCTLRIRLCSALHALHYTALHCTLYILLCISLSIGVTGTVSNQQSLK